MQRKMKVVLGTALILAANSAFAADGDRYKILGCFCETSSYWANGQHATAELAVSVFDSKKGTVKREVLATFKTGPDSWGHRQTDVDALCSEKVAELTEKGICN